MWTAISAFIARVWRTKLHAYVSSERVEGDVSARATVLLGGARWRNAVAVTLGADRFRLAVTPLFPFHAPVVVPFAAVDGFEDTSFRHQPAAALRLRDVDGPLVLAGPCAAELRRRLRPAAPSRAAGDVVVAQR